MMGNLIETLQRFAVSSISTDNISIPVSSGVALSVNKYQFYVTSHMLEEYMKMEKHVFNNHCLLRKARTH